MILKEFGYTPLDIKFNDATHTYRLDGIPMIGTTSIIGTKHKDWESAWKLKEMEKWLKGNWDCFKSYSQSERDAIIADAKKAWSVKSDKAMDSGKIGHKLIEESIITGRRDIGLNYNSGDEQTNREVSNIYSNWLLWEQQHPNIEYLAVELVMGSKVLWTAGTADVLYMEDGYLWLGDWKSSKRFSEDICLQSASYKYMLIEGGVTIPIKRRAIRLDKGVDANGEPIKDYTPHYEKVNDIEVPTDYDADIDAFINLRYANKWIKYIDKNFKKPSAGGRFRELIF
jgi:hypothetical protein